MFIELHSSGLKDINTKNHPKRKYDKIITIIKQELNIDESIKHILSDILEYDKYINNINKMYQDDILDDDIDDLDLSNKKDDYER